MIASIRMIAKMPTLAAMAYKYSIGQPFVYPKNDLDYAANFLRMCFAVPCEEYKPNPVLARAMDRIFILHADHEQNASTSTVRLAGSSGANPFACIAAGIACLWGPAHGGANEAALKMLAEIGTVDRIPEYIKRAKDKNDPFRLMGFGHRVYKNYDPRAKIMQKTCHEVLGELGIKDDPLLDVAMELERIALHDEYFIEKKLYPNVDFYSGITLKAMGFPTSDVHRAVRGRPHGRLDRAVEGDDRGSEPEDRPPAPALHRRDAARLQADLAAEVTGLSSALASPPRARPPRPPRSAARCRSASSSSSRANAASCRCRSGVSPISGASAAASWSGLASRWMNSGMTFSPSTRLASTIVGTRTMRAIDQLGEPARPGRRRRSGRRRAPARA